MSSFFRNILIIYLGLSFLNSCKKERIQLDYSELNSGVSSKLIGIYFLNETTGFICGGEKNESGIILKTINGGQSWNQVADYNLAILDISFVNDSLGFACGDSLLILKTTDGGNTWNKLNLPYTPVHIVPFTCIRFSDSLHGNVSGGKNWDTGIVMRTTDGGLWWEYQPFYDKEITENIYINDSTGYLTGYGAVYRTTSNVWVNNLLDVTGDFFTSGCFTSPNEGFVCGYEGSIYKTTDAGAKWKQVRKDNGAFSNRVHFNKIRFATDEKGIAVGNNGAVYYSDDAGENWKQSDNFPSDEIFSVFMVNDHTAFLCGEGGKVYKVLI